MCGSILKLEGIQKLGESSTSLLALASMIPQRPEPTMFEEKGKKYGLLQTHVLNMVPMHKIVNA